jgi:hypothetical protein
MSVVAAVFITLGYYLNLLVVTANGGMPVLNNVGLKKEAYDILSLPYPKWTGFGATTQFPYLGDILPFQFSAGDLLMIVGFILAVYIGIKWLIRRTV